MHMNINGVWNVHVHELDSWAPSNFDWSHIMYVWLVIVTYM